MEINDNKQEFSGKMEMKENSNNILVVTVKFVILLNNTILHLVFTVTVKIPNNSQNHKKNQPKP
jgi:hypothetical protein